MYGGATTMFYSYVMGIGDEILDLENKGFNINQYGNDYGVTFPSDKADVWEQFISHHLELGYWNEYLADNKIIFLFQLSDGLKRYEVYDFKDDEVLLLCEMLCKCKFQSIKAMLKENHFYKDKIG